MLKDTKYKGFSLIEILIVVGLILILAAVTIVAINPAKHFRDTRNSERSTHISEILNAVTQYTAEEGRTLDDLGTAGGATIPNCDSDVVTIGSEAGNLNLASPLVDDYMVEIPVDPNNGDAEDTGYTICQTSGGRVQIGATLETETGTEEVSVSR